MVDLGGHKSVYDNHDGIKNHLMYFMYIGEYTSDRPVIGEEQHIDNTMSFGTGTWRMGL